MTLRVRNIYMLITSIYLTFENSKYIDKVRHKNKTIEKNLSIININKLLNYTDEHIEFLCYYTIINIKPASLQDFYVSLSSLDNSIYDSKIHLKTDLINWTHYFNIDLEYVKNNYNILTVKNMFNAYIKKKIKLCSIYMFILLTQEKNNEIINKIKRSMIYSSIFKEVFGIMISYINRHDFMTDDDIKILSLIRKKYDI